MTFFEMTPREACEWAENPYMDISICQYFACKSPTYAYFFALTIPDADIEYCQKHVSQDPDYACIFAKIIPEANIESIYNLYKSSKYFGRQKVRSFILNNL